MIQDVPERMKKVITLFDPKIRLNCEASLHKSYTNIFCIFGIPRTNPFQPKIFSVNNWGYFNTTPINRVNSPSLSLSFILFLTLPLQTIILVG